MNLPESMIPSLHEAQVWCAGLREPDVLESYWDEALRPAGARMRSSWAEHRRPNDFYSVLHESTVIDAELVYESVEARRRLVSSGVTGTGRLLGYSPGENLADGAAELASEGFFDVDNIPAWGTWVGLSAAESRIRIGSGGVSLPVLIAWVPSAMVDLASRGLEANPEECVFWLD